MKHIFLSLIIVFFLFWNSFALTQESEYIIWDKDLSCYRLSSSQVFETKEWKIYFETSGWQELLALQNNDILPLARTEFTSRYIPFTVKNISQESDRDSPFLNKYTFWNLDTNISREIILDFDGYNSLSSKLNFAHSAKSYIPKYFISEDGINYSQIFQTDINDFRIQKLKIVFEPNTNEEIREIIRINTLNIERLNDIIEISWITQNIPVSIYHSNTCSKIYKQIDSQSEIQEEAQILNQTYLSENVFYTQRKTDTDNDWIQNLYDNCVDISNRDQLDINQNTVGDVCEFDKDSDGIADEIDNCRAATNPEQADDDKDGIGNVCDNCKLYNPNQFDTDTNGIWDVCDTAKNFLEENDDDNDWILNSEDNCKKIANSDQADNDNDGAWDVCDNCKSFQNFNQIDLNKNGIGDICEDSDNDGVDSITDNCPSITNPDQADSDNDGIGNVCEDDDGDSILFINDNCPYIYNRDQLDTDNDGLGDVCDESDNRFLESNKTVFIVLMSLIILLFLWGIFSVARKIQK